MRPRRELGIALGTVAVLALGAAILGRREYGRADPDPRRTTFRTGPAGASAFAGALERLGVEVERVRRRLTAADSTDVRGALVAVLGPARRLGAGEGIELARLEGADLLLAGRAAQAAMACFGYAVRPLWREFPALSPESPPEPLGFGVRAVLVETGRTVVEDSSALPDAVPIRCRVPSPVRRERLLVSHEGRPAALRLVLPGGRTVTLVADDRLFSNGTLREGIAGPFVLRLVVGRYGRILIDEYHQGFGPGGSLFGAVLRWSAGSPWGWAAWQLAAVGLIALLAAAVRFGPVRPAIERRRRSPLEHVSALATALAAARGHEVAVGLLVRGLRRRLLHGTPGDRRGLRDDPGPWLARLAPSLPSERGRRAAAALVAAARRPQGEEGVLRAAELVEEIWSELKPSRSAPR